MTALDRMNCGYTQPGRLLVNHFAESERDGIAHRSSSRSEVIGRKVVAIGEVIGGMTGIDRATGDEHQVNATGVGLPQVQVGHVPANEHANMAQISFGNGHFGIQVGIAKVSSLITPGIVFIVAPQPAVGRKKQQGVVHFTVIQEHK